MTERIAWIIVGAVVAVFVLTTLVLPFVVRGYSPPPSVGTVMGSMAGGAAAYLFATKGGGGNGKKPRRSPPKDEE